MRRYLRDPKFSRFDTIPECDGHTHTHRRTDTRRRHIPRLARRRAVKTNQSAGSINQPIAVLHGSSEKALISILQ